jgi:type II secretory pathway pseudopilin PulG
VSARVARQLRRLSNERAYALFELLTVLSILTIVLTGLTTLFVSATKSETDLRERFDAQQEARLAMDALRREVHCASAITQTGQSATVTLTLATGCPSGSGTVTWCTVGAGTRFKLYREPGGTCDATGSKRYADFLRPDAATTCGPNLCAFRYLVPTTTTRGKLRVELPVDVKPGDPLGAYKLVDELVLRNSDFL